MYLESIKRSLAGRLANHLLASGYAKFGKCQDDPERTSFVASITVALPGALDSQEKQTAEIATSLAADITSGLVQYGNDFGASALHERVGTVVARELRKVLARSAPKRF